MCGEHGGRDDPASRIEGSSPHVRGARRAERRRIPQPGIIPACAGSTNDWCESYSGCRDHPRMCGEHDYEGSPWTWSMGSSPHVRGAHLFGFIRDHGAGIIPACAGSTSTKSSDSSDSRDHPRMCGEHDMPPFDVGVAEGSSPHVRGAPDEGAKQRRQTGIIPACAGSTSRLILD